mgnify:CR=1 FL=1
MGYGATSVEVRNGTGRVGQGRAEEYTWPMTRPTLADKLVVAISSRALFDFEEENQHFEATNDRAYMRLQLDRVDEPAKPGVAFSLVNKLLAFNTSGTPKVEVVILSRNDPVSGMRDRKSVV